MGGHDQFDFLFCDRSRNVAIVTGLIMTGDY